MQVLECTIEGFKEVQQPNWETLFSNGGNFWVDITGPTIEDTRLMREQFKFHPLAIEDSTNQQQRPKVEEYPNHLFMILNPVAYLDGEVIFRELDVFLGKNFIVTVHPESEPLLKEVIARAERRMPGVAQTPDHLLYFLVDTVVDSYFPVLDAIGEEVDTISEILLEKPRQETVKRIFKLKREMTEMWRVVGLQRDMFGVLTRGDNTRALNQEPLRLYMRDVYDHVLRISDTVNTFRDTLSSMVDLYLSSASNRLNVVVQRLTVITIGTGALAVVTGFYGMNFEQTWPPFSAPWGVPFVLALMAVALAVVLLILWWID
jgi:magnesium transporter